MSPLFARLPRDFRNNLGKYLGILLLMVLATAATSGFLGSASSIKDICDGMRDAYTIEDFYFTTMYEMDEDDIAAVEAKGAKVYENFSRDLPIELSGENRDMSVRIFKNRSGEFNTAVYYEGASPTHADEIALDRVFCQNHELKLGDRIRVAGKDFELVGIMVLADYSVTYKSSGDFMFDAVSFTVAQLTDDAYEELVGDGETFSYSVVLKDRTMELADRVSFEEDCVDLLVDRGVSVTNLVDADSNIGLTFASSDIEADSTMWELLMFVLVIIMAFVFVVLTNASIEQESAVIGTLLASGYRKREILAHYMVLPTIIGLMGVALGNALGYSFFILPMKDQYYNSYSFPPFKLGWHWDIFLITSVLPFVVLMVITFLGLARKLGATPLQFLRHEVGGKLLVGGVKLPDWLSYTSRFRIRVFLRNLSHFATLFLGMMFGSILLLMALCMLPIVDYNAELMASDIPAEHLYMLKAKLKLDGSEQERKAWAAAEELTTNPAYDTIDLDHLTVADMERAGDLLADLMAVDDIDELEDPVNQTEIDADTLAQVEKFATATLSIPRRLSDALEEITVYGIAENSRYWKGYDVNHGSILVGQGLLEKCKVELGEPFTANDRFTNTDYTIEAQDSCGYGTTTAIYMSLDTFIELFDKEEDYFNGYISNEELALDERYLVSELTPDDMRAMSVQMQDSMGNIMNWFLWIVIPIYLVLIYLLTKTVIDRSARSISYMKVFGYRNHEIDLLYVRSITVTVIASLVLCLPLVRSSVSRIVPLLLSRYSGNFVMWMPTELLVRIVYIGLATYAVVAVLHLLRVRRVPLSLAMKVQE